MKIIQFVLVTYIIINGLEILDRKQFKKIIDGNMIEIIYLSLSSFIIYLRHGDSGSILLMSGILIVYEMIKSIQKELIKEKDQIVLYQIFSFINNQVRAGVRMEDVIGGVYEVITDKNFKKKMKKFCLIYVQEYDIEKFLEGVGENFVAEDFSCIEYAIKNSINIGINENVMTFQEDMMFNKYIGIIKKRGDRNKLKLFFSAILMSLVLFMEIGYPLFIDFMYSLKNIY